MHVDIRILFTHEKDQISKMASIIHHLILIIIHSAVLYGSSSKNPKDVQKAILDLLGLQQIPNGVDHWTDTDADIKMAPKYMLDLYEKYRDGRITRGKQVANTVRSIQAEVGLVRSQSMFVFNLTSILWSEKVLRAEIHVFKRRMKKNADPIDIFMEMHELGPTYIRKLDHRRIPEASFGWQAADVTSAVQACRHRNNGLPRMLAIAFTTESKDGNSFEPINVKSLVRKISRPYLVIYSNDTQNITVDHIKPHLSAQDLTSSYVEPSTGLREKFSSFNPDGQVNAGEGFEETPEDKANMGEGDQLDQEVTASPGEDDATLEKVKLPKQQRWYGDNKFFQFFASPSKAKVNQLTSVTRKSKDKHHNEVLDMRLRRSVLDNEIPDSPEDEVELEEIHKLAAIESTHPKILQGRTKTRKHGQKHHDREEQQLIPYPKDHNAKNNRGNRKHRKNRRKNRRQRQRDSFRVLSQNDWDVEKVFSDSEAKALCSKRTFTLDFADIGWSQWIISPRSFEANFCAGTCPFPLPQKLKPSNHATIQSLVHAIGLTDKVPSPCCVPEKMSSITLLFFDESKNVVLKNYPDMSVESCACR